MLQGFRKPIVMTGSQLPLASPRSDARANLIDALTCATSASRPPHALLSEVAVCFGGRLMRGNRSQKVNSSKCGGGDLGYACSSCIWEYSMCVMYNMCHMCVTYACALCIVCVICVLHMYVCYMCVH
jgi:Asparaginase, N-terminal